MMKKLKMMGLIVLLASGQLSAQSVWQWMQTGGGAALANNYDVVYGVEHDAMDNIYSCGIYHGTINFGKDDHTSTERSIFVVKRDKNGQVLWEYVKSGSLVSTAYNLALDANGDLIVVGQYRNTISFGTFNLPAGSGIMSSYILKLNGQTGAVVWAVPFLSSGDATSDLITTGVATDANGNSYVSGAFKGFSTTFNSASGYNSTLGGAGTPVSDAFLVKLDVDGNTQWLRRATGSSGASNSDKSFYSVTVDASGNPVAAGHFRSRNATLFPFTNAVNNVNTAGGTYDAMVASFDPSGNPLAFYRYGSSNNVHDDFIYDGVILSDGKLAIAGLFATSGAYVGRIDLSNGAVSGNALPVVASGSCAFYTLAADPMDNLYAAGTIATNNITFGTTVINNGGQGDILMAKIDAAGSYLSVNTFGSQLSTSNNEYGRGITVLAEDDFVVGGSFADQLSLGTHSAIASGNGNLFLARFAPCEPGFVFTAQPAASSVCENATATFQATVSGPATFTWYINGNAVNGANTGTLNYTTTAADQGATVSCDATGVCGSASSNTVTLQLEPAPTQTSITADQSLCVGTTANFTVLASGNGLSYQWQKDGNDLNGQTSDALNIANLLATDAGTYHVLVSSVCGSFTSDPIVLTVNDIPDISTQITDQNLCQGTNLQFEVIASGATGFQWYFNTQALSGETAAQLNINSVDQTHGGSYYLELTNSCGTLLSSAATLVVNGEASITSQPLAQSICEQTATQFEVIASGTGLSYQWQKEGVDLPGETASILNLVNVQPSDAAGYSVSINGSCGNPIQSDTVQLTVLTLPSISDQADSTQLCETLPAQLSVIAQGANLTYQWYQNNSLIAGATGSDINIAALNLSDAGDYYVEISGTCGTLNSEIAQIVVLQAPSIQNQPMASTVCEGSNAQFTVLASGSGLMYNWQMNQLDLAGETNADLNLTDVQLAQSGNYRLHIDGTCGSIFSDEVALNVNLATNITLQPVSTEVCPGGNVNLEVQAIGSNLSYQWYMDGVAQTGATNQQLNIPNVNNPLPQIYVLVSGDCGTNLSSDSVAVQLASTIGVNSGVGDQSVCEGNPAGFSISVSGTVLSYEWYFNSNLLAESTGDLNFPSVQKSDSGNYVLVINGLCNQITTVPMHLQVLHQTVITQEPVSVASCEGNNVLFEVLADGENLQYQWFLNGNILNGATAAQLPVTGISSNVEGLYEVNVGGTCGTEVTQPALLAVLVPSIASISLGACDQVVVNGQTYTQSGQYIQNLTNVMGCDSTLTIDVLIEPIDASVTFNGETISAVSIGVSYQWIDCATGLDVAGETGQSFKPTATGSYAVRLNNGFCSETSACTSVNVVGMDETSAQGAWAIYPNPSSGQFTVSLPGNPTKIAYVIRDLSGKEIAHGTSANKQFEIELNRISGLYLLEISADQLKLTKRLIVQ